MNDTIRTFFITRIEEELSSGANKPLIVNGLDFNGNRSDIVVKLMDSERMDEKAAAREYIGSLLAQAVGINTPSPLLVNVTKDIIKVSEGTKHYSRLLGSEGLNFGTEYLKALEIFGNYANLPSSMYGQALNIFYFDMLIQNPDRTVINGKSNLFTIGNEMYVLDHEIAFSFLVHIFGRPQTKAYEFAIQDMKMIQNHVLYRHLSKKTLDYSILEQNLNNINDSFWDYIEGNLPAHWITDEVTQIREHIEEVKNNHNTFISNIENLLS